MGSKLTHRIIKIKMATSTSLRHKMKLAKLSDKSLAYDNCVYLNPGDLQSLGMKSTELLLIDEQQVFQVKEDPKLKPNALGSSGLFWKSLHLNGKTAVGTTVMVEPWNNSSFKAETPIAQTVSIVVDTYTKAETLIKVEELENYIS